MRDLEQMIRFERENTTLDFKAIAYEKARHADLLKDAIALANADAADDRFIVMGVKELADGTKDLRGIPRESLPDAATYQQLVRDNVEPELHVEVIPLEMEGRLFGVIRIHSCSDGPYLLRKDYGEKLDRGDGWVRIGTHQPRLTRRDYDRIYSGKLEAAGFSDRIAIAFEGAEQPHELILRSAGEIDLPSDSAEREIREVLHARKLTGNPAYLGLLGSPFGPRPYSDQSIEQLKRSLADLERTYQDIDLYTLHEEKSAKVNLVLFNTGTSYLEDCIFELLVPKDVGLLVADRVHPEPFYDHLGTPMHHALFLGYPTVSSTDVHYLVRSKVGDLRHGIPIQVFQQDLRITALNAAAGKEFTLSATIYGRNLRKPIAEKLTLRVLP